MKTKAEIVQPHMKKANHLAPHEFIEFRENNTNMLLIDLRSDAEFNAGHIRGAINMNRGYVDTMLTELIPGITDDTVIVVYCIKGGISAMTQMALRDYGYKNVFDIAGGINNYADKGFSLFNIMGELKFENLGLAE